MIMGLIFFPSRSTDQNAQSDYVMQRHMPQYHLRDQGHTLASAVREVLEESHPTEFVACTVLHPMDSHIVVDAPSEAALRTALIKVKDKIGRARSQLHRKE